MSSRRRGEDSRGRIDDELFGLPGEQAQRYVWVAPHVVGARVIDLGCGVGRGTRFLASHGARQVVGVDTDEGAIDYAARHQIRDNLRFERLDPVLPDLPNATFDVAVSFGTAGDPSDTEAYLRNVRDSLLAGGRFYVSATNRRASGRGVRDTRRGTAYLWREYDPEEFIETLGRFFQVEQLYGQMDLTLGSKDPSRDPPPRAASGMPRAWGRSFRNLVRRYRPGRGRTPEAADSTASWRDYIVRDVRDISEVSGQFPMVMALCRRR